jgi:hypothetical protein
MEMVFWVLLLINILFFLRWIRALAMLYCAEIKIKVKEAETKKGEKESNKNLRRGYHYDRNNPALNKKL